VREGEKEGTGWEEKRKEKRGREKEGGRKGWVLILHKIKLLAPSIN
jgi:hypothetical protein